MDVMLLLSAAILGVVEGLTEFLPVSSTGHLIIAGDLLHFTGDSAKAFEIIIQLGAILAVVWHYRARFTQVVAHLDQRPAQRFVVNLFIAFLPAAVVGLATHHYIETYLFSPITVAWALVVGGIVILVIEALPHRNRVTSVDDISALDAFKVGVAQCFSLFPGVSRAGATIMGALLGGFSRKTATEFSFFLAVPVMFAATFYELYKNRALLHGGDAALLAVGFVTAFIVALIVIRLFLAFVGRHDFKAFAYYRIVFGLVALAYFWPHHG